MTESTNTEPTVADVARTEPQIPKMCKAGVVVNEGPNFSMKVEEVPVPEPGKYMSWRRDRLVQTLPQEGLRYRSGLELTII